MKRALLLLPCRLVLFFFFQAFLAMILASWAGSVKFWPLSATLANLVSLVLLYSLLRQENSSFFSLLRPQKGKWKTDLPWSVFLLIISVPLAIVPGLSLSRIFWGNTEYYHQILFQPVDHTLLYFLLVAYPVTTGLAELPTYFGYIMPRLKKLSGSSWLAVSLPVLAFSVQNCTLPLIFEARFILFRGIMYLPFALVYGILLYKRPTLLPWVVVLQVLIYLLPVLMLLNIAR